MTQLPGDADPSASQPEARPGQGGDGDRGLADERRPSPLDRLRGSPDHAPGVPVDTGLRPAPSAAEPSPAVITVGSREAAYGDQPSDPGAVIRSESRSHRGVRKQASFLRELPILIGIAIVLALLIKTFLVQAFFIPSGSMEQTLHVHDRVLVNKLAFHTGSPHRGEIVVFNTQGTGFATGDSTETVACPHTNPVVAGVRAVQRFIGVGTCGQDDYIKRIIAVPGDTISCCTAGHVVVDGKPLDEPYTYFSGAGGESPFCAASEQTVSVTSNYNPGLCGSDPKPITVPAGMYWVLGDHRDNSEDSRYHGFVPRDKLVGRAFIRIWPPGRIAFLRVPSALKSVGAQAVGMGASPVLAAPALALPIVGLRLRSRRRARRAAAI